MADKLKPCPFCGGTVNTQMESEDHEYKWSHCFRCGAEGPYSNTWEGAIGLWNTRPDPPAPEGEDTRLLDWLQCQTRAGCGGWVLRDSLTGRGLRLHQTNRKDAYPDVRDALRAALAKEKRG